MKKIIDCRLNVGELRRAIERKAFEREFSPPGCFPSRTPGWFDYQGPNNTQIDLRQGDLVEGQPGVDRHHIAQMLIEGVLNPSGEHRTVEIFSRPGAPVTDFEALFAATQPDTEAGRGALDQDLVPLADEPARVQADIARLRA